MKGEPVNALSWVGLTAREDASKNNYGWGREFGIMQTGRVGLRTTPNFSDLGGGRINDYELPRNRPWLRIVRQGNQWTAWSSADGITWEHGATHFIPTRPEMDAGLVFRALPQDARAYFQAKVSHLTLEPGVAKDTTMPVPVPAKNTAGPAADRRGDGAVRSQYCGGTVLDRWAAAIRQWWPGVGSGQRWARGRRQLRSQRGDPSTGSADHVASGGQGQRERTI